MTNLSAVQNTETLDKMDVDITDAYSIGKLRNERSFPFCRKIGLNLTIVNFYIHLKLN